MKFTLRIISIFIILLGALSIKIHATTNTNKMEKILAKYKNVDVNNISKEDLEKIYNEAIESYTAEELSDMIKDNKEQLKKQGITEDTIDKSADFVKTTDDKAIKKMLKNTDVKEVVKKIKEGKKKEKAILTSQKDKNDTLALAVKVFFSSYIIKTILIVIGVYILYKLIIRGIIYKKAGKLFISSFIPIYRDAVFFKICGHSPWIILWLLLPILGWIIYAIYKILMKFELAETFGHKTLFGIGLWLLNPIFESIIAFSKNKYELLDE